MTSPAEHAATVREYLTAPTYDGPGLIEPDHILSALAALVALAERATEPKVFRLEREARLAAEARVTELERERDVVQRQFQRLALDEVERARLMKQRVKDAEQRAERAETALRPYMEQHAKAWRDDKRAGECICVMCDAARAALGETAPTPDHFEGHIGANIAGDT